MNLMEVTLNKDILNQSKLEINMNYHAMLHNTKAVNIYNSR